MKASKSNLERVKTEGRARNASSIRQPVHQLYTLFLSIAFIYTKLLVSLALRTLAIAANVRCFFHLLQKMHCINSATLSAPTGALAVMMYYYRSAGCSGPFLVHHHKDGDAQVLRRLKDSEETQLEEQEWLKFQA